MRYLEYQIHRDRKEMVVTRGLGAGEVGELVFNGNRGPVLQDGKGSGEWLVVMVTTV